MNQMKSWPLSRSFRAKTHKETGHKKEEAHEEAHHEKTNHEYGKKEPEKTDHEYGKTEPEETVYGKMGPEETLSSRIPQRDEPGSFWEDRGDRRHCGVDLYAPENTGIISMEEGTVTETGLMTSPEILPYWNPTYYVIIESSSGFFCKYGELGEYVVQEGETIASGQLIGYVGTVLNCRKIDETCPPYIRKLKDKNPSMLHFELWEKDPISSHRNYLGGNWFSREKPENLLDPTEYLESVAEFAREPARE